MRSGDEKGISRRRPLGGAALAAQRRPRPGRSRLASLIIALNVFLLPQVALG